MILIILLRFAFKMFWCHDMEKRRVSYQTKAFSFQKNHLLLCGLWKGHPGEALVFTPPSSARLHWGGKAAPRLTCQGAPVACAVLQPFINSGAVLFTHPTPTCLLRLILFRCLLSRKRSKSQNSQFSLH